MLPGATPARRPATSRARVCRRAERRAWTLARSETVNPASLRYLNRLSDLLFVLARVIARQDGGSEVLWRPKEKK